MLVSLKIMLIMGLFNWIITEFDYDDYEMIYYGAQVVWTVDKVTQFWNTNLKELGCITKVDKHKIMLDDRVPSSEYLEEKMFVRNSKTERTPL